MICKKKNFIRQNFHRLLFKAMNRQIPSINKIVQFQNFKRSMELHESKIRNAKATLTTRMPNSPKSNINLNKTAKQPFGNSFSRMIDIELENKALLKKLTQKNNKPVSSISNSPNIICQQICLIKKLSSNRKKYYQYHKRRLQNQGLLKRLNEVKPQYQTKKYMSERKMTQKYINSISKFNYKNYKPNKTILKFDMDLLRQHPDFSSRTKQQNCQSKDKQNSHQNNMKQLQERYKEPHRNLQQERKISAQLKKKKTNIFTQRNFNLENKKLQSPIKQPHPNHILTYDFLQTNSIIRRSSERSQENRPQRVMQSSFVINQIPEKQIKINGKHFTFKAKQTITKLRLQILQTKRDKTIGNQYIHEVQIPSALYKKKFGGRIELIVQRLKFNKKAEAFYIS